MVLDSFKTTYTTSNHPPTRNNITTPFLVTGQFIFDDQPYAFDVCRFDEDNKDEKYQQIFVLYNKEWCSLPEEYTLPVPGKNDTCRDCGKKVEEEMKDVSFNPFKTTVAELRRCKKCWDDFLLNIEPGCIRTICAGCGSFSAYSINSTTEQLVGHSCSAAFHHTQESTASPKKRERATVETPDDKMVLDPEQKPPSPKRSKTNDTQIDKGDEEVFFEEVFLSSAPISPLRSPVSSHSPSPRRISDSSSSSRVVYRVSESNKSAKGDDNAPTERKKRHLDPKHEADRCDPDTGESYYSLYKKRCLKVDELEEEIKLWKHRYNAEVDRTSEELINARAEINLLKKDIHGDIATIKKQQTGLSTKNQIIERLEDEIFRLGGNPLHLLSRNGRGGARGGRGGGGGRGGEGGVGRGDFRPYNNTSRGFSRGFTRNDFAESTSRTTTPSTTTTTTITIPPSRGR